MNLAGALANYSQRNKGKVIFRTGLSLNKLALAMWEQSEFCGIDASILSKVLSGKRLFTPLQLNVFCKVLNIKHGDREYLFYCLHKDQYLKNGIVPNTPFVPSSGTHLFIKTLMHQADSLFRAGKWKDLYDLSGIMRSYLYEYVSTMYPHTPEDPLITTYQKVLYLRARSMTSIAPQDTIMKETRAVIRALRHYPNKTFAHLTPGYVASLEAYAYRVLGLFPTPRNATFDPKTAAMSRRCAAKALEVLPPTDFEYVGSLRNVIDSSIALGERDAFLYYSKIAKRIVSIQPKANFLNAMQLAVTVGKGMAVFKIGDPFVLKEKTEKYFNRTLAGTKIFELSILKTELEIYIALGSTKDSLIKQKIQRALTLADEESPRFRVAIIRLAEQL